MKHKVSFFIILLVSLVIPQSVKAYTFSAVAPSGQTLYFYFNGGNAIVTYPGTWNGNIYSCSGTECYKTSGDLIIPESVSHNGNTYPVTAIGEKAFCNCNQLSSVVIPSSVTSIGANAFSGCSGLTSVTIGSSVISIGDRAFNNCSGLTGALSIPNSVISIGDRAFNNCSGLTGALSIPNSVTSIGDHAFYNCSGLTYVTIGNSVTSIGDSAFDNCSGLTEITSMSSGAPSLGLGAFLSVATTIPINIPCGSSMSYYSRWSYFSNFIEESGFTFNASSADSAMGTVAILTEATCQSSTTVFMAIAKNGYRFSHWSDGDTDNPRILTLIQDTTIAAIFESNPLSFNVIANNAVGGGVYTSGRMAEIYALPQIDLQFAGWSDGETVNPRYIVVTSDTTLTALFRAPDTIRVYDTVINIVYDTTEFDHYYFDTVHIYDTLIVYDTTRIFDTLVYVSIDTMHHYYFDTTRTFDTLVLLDTARVFDTIVYVNVDTLHHYHYDTTRVYDTMVFVNVDTMHHYYYDTTRVFDTLVYVHNDTLNHYYYDTTRIYDTVIVFDMTRVYDTMVYVNVDTLHHYYYDTTRVFDTLVYVNNDTLHHYYFDTTRIYDTMIVFDMTRVYDTMVYVNVDTLHHYYYDTTWMFDTIVYVNIDTLNHYYFDTTRTFDTLVFYDTTSVTHYIFDSTWVFDSVWVYDSVYIFDTIYIHDTIFVGINDVEVINAKIYIQGGQIVVEGADGNTVTLYDINGRVLATKHDEYSSLHFDAPTSGTYLIKIGNHPARKVVVIR